MPQPVNKSDHTKAYIWVNVVTCSMCTTAKTGTSQRRPRPPAAIATKYKQARHIFTSLCNYSQGTNPFRKQRWKQAQATSVDQTIAKAYRKSCSQESNNLSHHGQEKPMCTLVTLLIAIRMSLPFAWNTWADCSRVQWAKGHLMRNVRICPTTQARICHRCIASTSSEKQQNGQCEASQQPIFCLMWCITALRVYRERHRKKPCTGNWEAWFTSTPSTIELHSLSCSIWLPTFPFDRFPSWPAHMQVSFIMTTNVWKNTFR